MRSMYHYIFGSGNSSTTTASSNASISTNNNAAATSFLAKTNTDNQLPKIATTSATSQAVDVCDKNNNDSNNHSDDHTLCVSNSSQDIKRIPNDLSSKDRNTTYDPNDPAVATPTIRGLGRYKRKKALSTLDPILRTTDDIEQGQASVSNRSSYINERTSLLRQNHENDSYTIGRSVSRIIEEQESSPVNKADSNRSLGGSESDDEDLMVGICADKRPTAQEFYFPQSSIPNTRRNQDDDIESNDKNATSAKRSKRQQQQQQHHHSTIQRYYRFTSTPLTPIAALYKRPLESNTSAGAATAAGGNNGGNVTGLLRRSAVVPSHGTDSTGRWILVSVGGRSGWAKTKYPVQQSNQHPEQYPIDNNSTANANGGFFVPANTFRAMEAWMGNHSFYWNGKIMLGSDAPSLFLASFLIVASSIIHLAYILPTIHRQKHDTDTNDYYEWYFSPIYDRIPLLYWVSVLLMIGTLLSLWTTAMMDPGIIPPSSSPIKAPIPLQQPQLQLDGSSGSTQPPQYVPIGGPYGYRYCSTCNIFRPPRSKHCNSCNVCVAVFDHHCPWVGNCIGQRNYSMFIVFLLFVSSLSILVTICIVCIMSTEYNTEMIKILQLSSSITNTTATLDNTTSIEVTITDVPSTVSTLFNSTDLESLQKYGERSSHTLLHVLWTMPGIVLFGIFSIFTAWSVVSLVFYHSMIISVGQTTNERVRGIYRYSNNVYNPNQQNQQQPGQQALSTSSDHVVTNGNNNPANHGCCINWYKCTKSVCFPVASKLPRDFSEIVITNPNDIHETVWHPPKPSTVITTTTSPINNNSNYNPQSASHQQQRFEQQVSPTESILRNGRRM